jgi:HD-GYP domain-containing protein (c-di-GMP phosphodiesterase class II)
MNKSAVVVPFVQVSMLFIAHQDEHDETIQHTLRCTDVIGKFGSYLGLAKEKIRILEEGAMIHDVGKFFLSADMLYSPRSLSRDEFTKVKAHPLLGDFDILNKDVKAMKEQHHEYLDGSGYPYGLKGNAINPYTQILTIVDIHDALTYSRSYKKAWTEEDVRSEMTSHRGTRFNAELLDEFYRFLDKQKRTAL